MCSIELFVLSKTCNCDVCCDCADDDKGCCKSQISVLPVVIVFTILLLVLIGFIILAVLIAVRLNLLLSVSI